MLFFLFLHGELIYNSSNLRSGPILAVLVRHSLARRNVIYKAKRKLSMISGYNSSRKRRLLLKKRKKRTENNLKEKKRKDILLWRALASRPKPPCFNVLAPITHDIMRSRDAQCNAKE